MAKIDSNVVKKDDNKENSMNMDALVSKLHTTLSIDVESCYTTLDSGVEIVQKKYQFANPIGKKESITVFDREIIESIEKITVGFRAKKVVSYAICREFANIQNSGKLESMGFKNIAEFAKALFDLESSTANHYTKIGNAFINSDYSVKAGLPELGVSHFIELNALVGENGSIDQIIGLYTSGTLTDGMSTKKIREVLKSLKTPTAIEDKSGNSEESEDKSENSENTASSTENATTSTENPAVVENLAKEYDVKVAVAQLLAHYKAMTEIVVIMAENGTDPKAISDNLEKLAASVRKVL